MSFVSVQFSLWTNSKWKIQSVVWNFGFFFSSYLLNDFRNVVQAG